MSQLKDMLGKGSALEFGERQWWVCPLTFNDLCDLEDRFGDVASIDLTRASTQRFLLWLVLRNEESGKRFEDEFAVGELLSLNNAQKTAEFVAEVFRISGLTGHEVAENEKKPQRAASRRKQPSQSELGSAE